MTQPAGRFEQAFGTTTMVQARTLYDKIWDDHVVEALPDGTSLIYIDRHLVHEVTSPQAFEGLRAAGRRVRAPNKTLAVVDHNVPTTDRSKGIDDPESRLQVETLAKNVAEFGLEYFDERDIRQGIVHVIGPEQGFTLPGTTIVCGDSHTSTHGAFGALAHGIGTSEVEHVLATQTLVQKKALNMRVTVDGVAPAGITAKDIALAIIGELGTAGGTGHVIEYAGEAIRALSMEGRMSLCNMSIEAGARAGMVAPDEKTFAYLAGAAARAARRPLGRQAVRYWRTACARTRARCSTSEIHAGRRHIAAAGHLGHQPAGRHRHHRPRAARRRRRRSEQTQPPRFAPARWPIWASRACEPITDVAVDRVFIGSCTNSRIEDLRAAAAMVAGKQVASGVAAMVVPGSGLVKQQAEAEGLDAIFKAAGFEWREPGCSMCLAMNPDKLGPGERCASTSNRNFEGRQGHKGRTHLVSPPMAAAAAIAGHFVDIRDWR